jgi:hypothetical protein
MFDFWKFSHRRPGDDYKNLWLYTEKDGAIIHTLIQCVRYPSSIRPQPLAVAEGLLFNFHYYWRPKQGTFFKLLKKNLSTFF